MSFFKRYELVRLLKDGEARSFRARQRETEREVLLHMVPAGEAPANSLADSVRKLKDVPDLLEIGEFGGFLYVVTASEEPFAGLRAWIEARGAAAPGESEPAVKTPAKPAPPPSAPAPAAKAPEIDERTQRLNLEFEQLFDSADHGPAPPPPKPEASKPPAIPDPAPKKAEPKAPLEPGSGSPQPSKPPSSAGSLKPPLAASSPTADKPPAAEPPGSSAKSTPAPPPLPKPPGTAPSQTPDKPPAAEPPRSSAKMPAPPPLPKPPEATPSPAADRPPAAGTPAPKALSSEAPLSSLQLSSLQPAGSKTATLPTERPTPFEPASGDAPADKKEPGEFTRMFSVPSVPEPPPPELLPDPVSRGPARPTEPSMEPHADPSSFTAMFGVPPAPASDPLADSPPAKPAADPADPFLGDTRKMAAGELSGEDPTAPSPDSGNPSADGPGDFTRQFFAGSSSKSDSGIADEFEKYFGPGLKGEPVNIDQEHAREAQAPPPDARPFAKPGRFTKVFGPGGPREPQAPAQPTERVTHTGRSLTQMFDARKAPPPPPPPAADAAAAETSGGKEKPPGEYTRVVAAYKPAAPEPSAPAPEAVAPTDPDKEKKRKKRMWLWIGGGVLLVIVIAVVLYFVLRQPAAGS